MERQHRRQPVLVTRIQHSPVVVERGESRTRPPRARCATTRASSGRRRARARPRARCRPRSGGSDRRHRPRPRRRARTADAPRASCRCRRCRPRPGGPRSPCPTGTRRESSCRRGRAPVRETCAARPVSAMTAAAAASGAAVSMWMASSAPINAPTSIAPTARMRRPIREPAPPASAESAAIPVSVIVSTVVVSSATASLRAVEFWMPMARASTAIRTKRVTSAAARTVAVRTKANCTASAPRSSSSRRPWKRPPSRPAARLPAEERSDRDQRRPHRETRRPTDREAQEDHVAGHVGNEDVAQVDITRSIDESRHERECQEQRRQRAIGPVSPWPYRFARFGPGSHRLRDGTTAAC